MDHERCRELLWDMEELDENEKKLVEEHLASCDDCREEQKLIGKIKNDLPKASISVADRVCEAMRAEKRRRAPLSLLKYGTVAALALVVVIFAATRAFENGKFSKEQEDCMADSVHTSLSDGANGAPHEAESPLPPSYSTKDEGIGSLKPDTKPESTGGSYNDDADVEDSVFSEPESGGVKEEPAPEPSPDPIDTQLLLDDYKTNNSISSRTADIVVSGKSIENALEALLKYNAKRIEDRVVVNGDKYFEVQSLLKDSGFSVVLATSSENPSETVVYFIDTIK